MAAKMVPILIGEGYQKMLVLVVVVVVEKLHETFQTAARLSL